MLFLLFWMVSGGFGHSVLKYVEISILLVLVEAEYQNLPLHLVVRLHPLQKEKMKPLKMGLNVDLASSIFFWL